MSRSLNATAASLLGFLHDGPMTGWDLVAVAQQRIGNFWTLTQSQVYRELAAMELFLVLAIAAEWSVIDMAARILFAAFGLLGLVMLGRADQARRIRPRGPAGPSSSYVAHVGFTLVALFDAFIVILVLNLGAPGWLAGAAGVLIAVAGHFVLRAVRERLVGSTAGRRGVSLTFRPHRRGGVGERAHP